jgi:P27 family predicted phage terminase small subunit
VGARGPVPGKAKVGDRRGDPPPPPDDLSEFAQELWRSTAAELRRRKLWSVLDVEALRRYCVAVDLARHARSEWAKMGRPLTSAWSTGQLKPHALIELAQTADRDAAKFGSVLLLEPAARARMGVEEEEDLVARFDDNVALGLADAKDRAVFEQLPESQQRRWLMFGRPPTQRERLQARAMARDHEPPRLTLKSKRRSGG